MLLIAVIVAIHRSTYKIEEFNLIPQIPLTTFLKAAGP